jgi:hypothetical protein
MEIEQASIYKIVAEHLNVSASESLIESHISGKEVELKGDTRTYKSINSFYSAINRAIDAIKSSGFDIKSRKIESDDFIELTILVPKQDTENTSN